MDIHVLNARWQSSWQSLEAILPPDPDDLAHMADPHQPHLPDVLADWIAFREHELNQLVSCLHGTIRAIDKSAIISAPLGECFRSGSAEFANQDIFGLTRDADNVVFSYDFFIHEPEAMWQADALVRTYHDITGLPIHVELDGIGTGTYGRYGEEGMFDVGKTVLEAGAAGLNIANFSQEREWVENLDQYPFMRRLGEHIEALNRGQIPYPVSPEPHALIYLSKLT